MSSDTPGVLISLGLVCAAETPSAVLDAFQSAVSAASSASHAASSLAFHRLAWLCSRQGRVDTAAVLADPRTHTLVRFVRTALPHLNGRQLSDVVWAYVKLGGPAPGEAAQSSATSLLADAAPYVLRAAKRPSSKSALQELASIAWSLARATPADGATATALLKDLAPWVVTRLEASTAAVAGTADDQIDFSRSVATLCWAYGTAGTVRDAALLDALAAGAMTCRRGLTTQGLCHVAWGLARLDHTDAAVLTAMGDSWVDADGCAPIDAATLMYALTLAGCRHERVIARVRALVLSPSGSASLAGDSRALPSLAWSLASLAYGVPSSFDTATTVVGEASGEAVHDDELWTALEELLVERSAQLDPQGLTMAASAVTTARHDSPRVLAAVASAAMPLVKAGAFSAQQLSMLAFALGSAPDVSADSKSRHVVELMHALLDAVHAAQGQWHTWSERELANTAWGLAVGGINTWCPAFVDLRAALARRAADESLNSVPHLAQMHQVEQVAAMQQSSSSANTLLLRDNDVDADAATLPASHLFHALFQTGVGRLTARRAWDSLMRGRTSPGAWSALQRDVAGCVMTVCANAYPGGPPVVCEFVPSDIAQSLDVAWPAIKCALEVDGPLHFAANTRRPLGATRLKRQLLAHAGWKCISVPYYAWDRLGSTPEQKEQYIQQLFISFGIHDALQTYLQKQQEQRVVVFSEPKETADASTEPRVQRDRRDELSLAMARTGTRASHGARAALKDVLASRVSRATAQDSENINCM